MSPEPRYEGDYTHRQVDAARRVLVDVGQVLASFGDAIVVKKNHPKLVEGFRVLQFPACAAAFGHPEDVELKGAMISGALNTVRYESHRSPISSS